MSGWAGVVELLLVFGLVIWFGYSQIRAVRRRDDGPAEPRRTDDEPPA